MVTLGNKLEDKICLHQEETLHWWGNYWIMATLMVLNLRHLAWNDRIMDP